MSSAWLFCLRCRFHKTPTSEMSLGRSLRKRDRPRLIRFHHTAWKLRCFIVKPSGQKTRENPRSIFIPLAGNDKPQVEKCRISQSLKLKRAHWSDRERTQQPFLGLSCVIAWDGRLCVKVFLQLFQLASWPCHQISDSVLLIEGWKWTIEVRHGNSHYLYVSFNVQETFQTATAYCQIRTGTESVWYCVCFRRQL